MPDQRTIWKRRMVVMAIVGLVIAIPVTIAVRGGDDGDETTTAAPEPELPRVGKLDFDRDLGIQLRLPKGWKRKEEKGGAVSFRSRDGSVLIAVSSPGPAEDYEEIHEAALASIKDEYDAVHVGDTVTKLKLGGRRAKTTVIAARIPKSKDPTRILVSAARGEKLAYLVEVFAAGKDPNQALVEAQVLLNNLELEG